MQKRLIFFGLTWLFWIVIFELSRILFLVYHFESSATLTLYDYGMMLFLGLRMDASMAAYWTIPTGLILTFSPWLSTLSITKILRVVTSILLFLSCLIIVTDLELYRHWGFRLNTTPFFYISKEAAGSIGILQYFLLIGLFTLLFGSMAYFYFRKLAPKILHFDHVTPKISLPQFLVTALLFIPIRSSFDVAPLNTGMVYYHKTKNFPNHAGINVVWNFLKSAQSKKTIRYPSDVYSGDYENVLNQGIQTQGITKVVTQEKPNVILIILESFTAKIIEPLGGQPGVTPELNALVKEGILFSNFYASGDRTDKGLISLLSAYPAQPKTSIIKFPEKTQSLDFLPREMEALGYKSSYVYGGDIGFANMASYLTMSGFRHITQGDDFPASINNSKWGVADHFVFNRLEEELDTAATPFFKVMLTLSSHEPFEVPMDPVIEGNDESTKFLNSCHYTDKSLGDFIRTAKTKPWWNSTLIIITADHGHRFPNPEELKEKERFKIPMLWLGGALNKKDTVISTLGGQADLAPTLLYQLGGPTENKFRFGKNMLAFNTNPFAIYIFNNGYGLVTPGKENVYDFDVKDYLRKESDDRDLEFAKAYLQTLFNDYNNR